jgi:hypothetical protein
MNLLDCFYDPLNIMDKVLTQPVELIDVNNFPDDDAKQQQLSDIMEGALKNSRNMNAEKYLARLALSLNSLDFSNDTTLKFIRTLLSYLLGVGNEANFRTFFEAGNNLIEPVRGELLFQTSCLSPFGPAELLKITPGDFLTIAEKLRAMGAEQAKQVRTEEIAVNSLKEGIEPAFVARITGLELAVVLRLKAKLEDDSKAPE